ncbi:MAG: pyrroline-5-carboxylate reductase [Planctomycetota bacterium]
MSTLAILGCGNMGGAILRSLLEQHAPPFDRFLAFDPDETKRAGFAPAVASSDAVQAVGEADVVLLATKPQVMGKVLEPLGDVAGGKLFVSIAAGLPTTFFEDRLPGGRVVRTMPNTPLLVGHGVVGVCGSATASSEDVATAKSLFPTSKVFDLDESQMDALTAVSGSGPAYFFYFVECLAAAAADHGFSPDVAYELAAATFAGSATLLGSSDADAATLRERVTSPGGTTAAGLETLRNGNLPILLKACIKAATRRGRELSQP